MSVAPDTEPLTIAGHSITLLDRAGGLLNLRIALHGGSFVALARALAKVDGVRVTSGPEAAGRERCYIAHCPGFKMVVSSPPEEAADFALALVSRTPQAALIVMSDLGAALERLMSAPPPVAEVGSRAPRASTWAAARAEARAAANGSTPASSSLSRSSLKQGQPLARKTALKRKTPLRRGRGPGSL